MKIGQKEYKFKKDAIAHYRAILNSYDFGQSLSEADFDDIIDLLDYAYFNNLAEIETLEEYNIVIQNELNEKENQSLISERDIEALRMWTNIIKRGEINSEEEYLFSRIWKTEKGIVPWFEAFNWSEEKIELAKTLIDNGQIDIEEKSICIEDIRIAKVQFNTKCFELVYDDQTSHYISYLMMINNAKYSTEKLFNIACRNSIIGDIRTVKQDYFDKNSVKGQVKCQETGLLSKWTELVVDHRQPNTFSVIIDRFKEINRIDLETIEYTSNEQNHIIFVDQNIAEKFRLYHKEKAKLRIVRSECNSGRTGMARIKMSKKDLLIK